jgi:hypothetical protein
MRSAALPNHRLRWFCGLCRHDQGGWEDLGGNTVADECSTDCTGDLDGNGEVGVDDLLAVIATYQQNDDGDCDGDGDTDVDDLLLLIAAWGTCP